MADEIDQANDIEQALMEKRIKSAESLSKSIDTSNPSGICWSCEAETGPDRRWCSVECRDVYEKN